MSRDSHQRESNSITRRGQLTIHSPSSFNAPCTTYITQPWDFDDGKVEESNNDIAWPLNEPGAQEVENVSQQVKYGHENSTLELGEHKHNNNEATLKCHQKISSPTSR